eukprot:TRINITY_DN2602_c0_g1_i3.p1 TRINITY_DN2602_c0_g1~~TRINITY_DN2602_c0_g1_i3.p1  ORF type:complete len:288 (-),score=52.30 TRINITY_DN2602_c0_g1_i3:210-1073(-)
MCALWLLLFVVSQVSCQPPVLEGGENVVDLTSENWDEHMGKRSWVLVEYYSPICGYCRAFAPEYEKVGNYLKGTGITIARVNVLEEKEKWKETGARGVPHIELRLPSVKEVIVYDGARDAIDLVNWVTAKMPVLQFTKKEQAMEYIMTSAAVYPTRTLLVANAVTTNDVSKKWSEPLIKFKDLKAIAAVWRINPLDEKEWLYPMPTLVVTHALQTKQEYYKYNPTGIDFETLLLNLGEEQSKIERSNSWFSFGAFSFLFFCLSVALVYRFFIREASRPKIQFHKGEF